MRFFNRFIADLKNSWYNSIHLILHIIAIKLQETCFSYTYIHFRSNIFFYFLPTENLTFHFDSYLQTGRKALFDALVETRCFQSISGYNKAFLCLIVNVMIPYLPISSFTEPKNDHYWMSKMTCIDFLSIDVSKMIYIYILWCI